MKRYIIKEWNSGYGIYDQQDNEYVLIPLNRRDVERVYELYKNAWQF